MKLRTFWFEIAAAMTVAALFGATDAGAAPLCRADALALSVERSDVAAGSARLVVANRSGASCILPGLPLVGFADRAGRVMHAARRVPVGFHPGPVVVPARLTPGAQASARLSWTPVPGHDGQMRCAEADAVLVMVSGGALRRPIGTRLCGPADGSPSFAQTPFTATGR